MIRPRSFKTKWFSKEARRAAITDKALCKAMQEIRLGQCENLGGGVFKKRVNKNLHRTIVVAKGEKYWVFAFLFAKSSKENIEDDELKSFKDLANLYAKKNDDAIQKELDAKELLEICNEEEIQE